MSKKNRQKNQNYLENASYAWSEDSIRLILSPSDVARATYFYIQEIGHFKTFFPYFTERQNLNSFLIVYTTKGCGRLEYEGKMHLLSPGFCFFINCMVHHKYEVHEDSTWEFLWMHFNGTNALGYYNEFHGNAFSVLQVRDPSFMEHTLLHLISIHRKRNLTTELIASNLITNILTELLVQNFTSSTETILIPQYIKDVMKDIDTHFRDALSLDYFADRHHISKYHLSREFKKYIGTTIHEYIIGARLAYAKELLKYSELTIGEIAYDSGFNNVSHFINLFQNREDLTPLEYRKEWKK